MSTPLSRRGFLATGGGLALGWSIPLRLRSEEKLAAVDRAFSGQVLDLATVAGPVRIDSMELLRNGSRFLVRTRSADGVEVVTVPHQSKMALCHPIFTDNVAPFFVGRNALDLEDLLWEVYRHRSNYKMQGLAFWICVAAAEMAVLELLGRTAGLPLASFFGGARQRDIDVYYASGNRGNSPEEEIEHLRRLVGGSGVRALKFRLGGRMMAADEPPGRSEALVPLVRETFGPDFVLYADANSSYDADSAIRIGRSMEEHGYGFFEEPCPFDDLWSTKQVADELDIPVAGGEQEYSMHRWRWAIASGGLDIVQPDLHYGGGFVRATRVARAAEAAGMAVVPHMSGGGLGYVEVVHFSSFTPNIGPFMEFKGGTDIPVECATSSLRCEGGSVRCPEGPGFGVEIDPDFVSGAKKV